MEYIIIAFISFLLGVLLSPIIVFIRARRDKAWDDSNMLNMIRIFAHLATHPSDFGKMRYDDDGTYPFWYINQDEFHDIVKTRPSK